MKTSLKACPWCGGMPELKVISMDRGNGRGYPGNFEYYVQCSSCGATAPDGKTEDIYRKPEEAMIQARDAWNNRRR